MRTATVNVKAPVRCPMMTMALLLLTVGACSSGDGVAVRTKEVTLDSVTVTLQQASAGPDFSATCNGKSSTTNSKASFTLVVKSSATQSRLLRLRKVTVRTSDGRIIGELDGAPMAIQSGDGGVFDGVVEAGGLLTLSGSVVWCFGANIAEELLSWRVGVDLEVDGAAGMVESDPQSGYWPHIECRCPDAGL